jgi:predicted aspartyl protease
VTFNLKFNDQNGRPMPPMLVAKGPVVPVRLMPAAGGQAQRKEHSGLALIDTGSAVTGIDRQSAEELGLPVVNTGRVTSATHADEVCPIFVAQLHITDTEAVINANRAFGLNLRASGLIALIGRDLLSLCVLTYDGPKATVSLAVT